MRFRNPQPQIRASVQALLVLFVLMIEAPLESSEPDAAIEIGSRRELFLDRSLIEKLSGEASLKLQTPRDEGIVLKFDQPWEKRFCGYITVLHDPPLYRMYYHGWLADSNTPQEIPTVTCYAESTDGKTWIKPELGMVELFGSKANNVLRKGGPYTINFAPFVDRRPGAPASERFKALAGTDGSGLVPFVSADGKDWRYLVERAVLKIENGFDSLNVPFWSEHEGQYVAYVRKNVNGMRRVARATSSDFLNWTTPELMEYGDAPIENLYVNQTQPYFRAPHIFVGLAARFMYQKKVLSPTQAAAFGAFPGYESDCSEGVLISTRGGNRYDRTFMEGFLRPTLDPGDWLSRTNYPANGVAPTGPTEMSFYANHHYSTLTAHVRRYSLRVDGFSSANGSYRGGEVLTKPLVFRGKRLLLNFATSAAGSLQAEVQDAMGKPLPNFTLADSMVLAGNTIEQAVSWKTGDNLTSLADRPVRIRFVLKDADLFSFQFRD